MNNKIISISSTDLSLVKYITKFEKISLEHLSNQCNKSRQSIYRLLRKIQHLLPKSNKTTNFIGKTFVCFDYLDYLQIYDQLSMSQYQTSKRERIEYIFVLMCLSKITNRKAAYEDINSTVSSLKADSSAFDQFLTENAFTVKIHHGRGSELIGDEFQIRMSFTLYMMKLISIDSKLKLQAKRNITPVEKMLAVHFIDQTCSFTPLLVNFFNSESELSAENLFYNSRKLCVIYFLFTQIRHSQGYVIRKQVRNANVPILLPFHAQQQESVKFSQIYHSLSFREHKILCYNNKLLLASDTFLADLYEELITPIKNKKEFFDDIYSTLNGIIERKALKIEIVDKKLDADLYAHFTAYKKIKSLLRNMEKMLKITFKDHEISLMYLTVKKYSEMNKSSDRYRKKICFITNSSMNKFGYLIEKLKSNYHIDIVDIFDVNELYQLENIDYDHLLCFTNKIKSMVEGQGYEIHKINFQFDDLEIRELGQTLNLSRSSRKIPLTTFIREIEGMSRTQIHTHLKENYKDYFI